jgi:adenylate cyclase
MWILTLRSPSGEPVEYTLQAGTTKLGRNLDNGIPIPDISASRIHADIEYAPQAGVLTIRDLNSTNGTYVNRQRILRPTELRTGDSIRIGEHVITVSNHGADTSANAVSRPSSRPLTRDVVLESLDHHAVLMYKVAEQLNTVLDIDAALREVSELMRSAMGADKCEVILPEQFGKLREYGFPETIAQDAIQKRTTVILPVIRKTDPNFSKSALLLRVRSALCVPVITGDDLLGLLYMYKTDSEARPFNETDLSVAIAISNQAALTIQRARLVQNIQKEQQARNLLLRFLSPREAEFLLQDYLQNGSLPPLTARKLTVLFADIVDSTGLAERLGASGFGEILKRYYEEMTAIIFEHGGMLDKYMGDEVMAVFGMNPSQSDPEIQAVSAGLKMLERLKINLRENGIAFEIGIGINTGFVVAGYVGTAERVEFTVLGDPVNVAHRLEALARPNRVVIGPVTAASIADRFRTRRLGAVEVRGRSQTVQAHEVLSSVI